MPANGRRDLIHRLKVKGQFFTFRAMQSYSGSGSTAPPLRNLGTRVKFNIKKFCVISPHNICVSRIDLKNISYYFPELH